MLKNSLWTERTLEIQRLADSGDTRGFFSATKAVYGQSYHGLSPLHSKDDQELLKDNESINARWKDYFQELLNNDSSTKMDITKHIPQSPIREYIGELTTIIEVKGASGALRTTRPSVQMGSQLRF